MMKLGTHKERMEALEHAFDVANGAMEKASIVQAAAQIDRDNQYVEQNRYSIGSGSIQGIAGSN